MFRLSNHFDPRCEHAYLVVTLGHLASCKVALENSPEGGFVDFIDGLSRGSNE